MAGQFIEHEMHIGVHSEKRDVLNAIQMTDYPEAWILPPIDFVHPDDIATIDDIKEYQTALAKRLKEGEYDDEWLTEHGIMVLSDITDVE
jgi:hypothetical protein